MLGSLRPGERLMSCCPASARPATRRAAPPAVRRWFAVAMLFALTAQAAPSRAARDVSIPADHLVEFLNQTISLYHQTSLQGPMAADPRQQMFLFDSRQMAGQVVRFAFDFARAYADAMTADTSAAMTPATTGGPASSTALGRMLITLDRTLQDTNAEMSADRKKLASATGARRAELQSQVEELGGEVALAQVRRDALRNMLAFVSSSTTDALGASGLKAQIDALAASVPGAGAGGSAAAPSTGAPAFPAASARETAPSGIWDLIVDLGDQSSQVRTLDAMIKDAQALEQTSDELRAPFVTTLRALSSRGDQLAAQADSANRALLAEEKQQLDGLAAQFKGISTELIPLGKLRVLLGLYQKNLVSWRDSVDAGYRSDLRDLGIRLGTLALALLVLLGASELWRRAVNRYVLDARRRHQFLLLRKLTLWLVIGLMIALTLAGRFGSFATFAGLLTAGVAVALQNVILAVVGYFFLIGKFGIRVGDRVEVSGITGEVIDIGLVRFHLMELGVGATLTGRVVAFANSVVFQPTAGLFKQIPGASFTWHQVALTVPGHVDFSSVKAHLLGAVEGVLADYRESLERAYGEMERRGILFSERGLRPKLELHLMPGGIEAVIRYPVDLQSAADIDARVSRELLAVLDRDVTARGSDAPEIHVQTGGAA
jgi:hypothetical protein